MSLDFRIETIAEIDSTNRWVREMALAGAAEGLALRAERQSAGRGRLGREWVSPPGNLYLSLLLRPPRRLAEIGGLAFLAGIAIAEFLTTILPDPAAIRLKWPNDVLVDGRKIAGILIEAQNAATLTPSAGEGDRCAFVVLGLGLNLVSHPQGALYPATDIRSAGGRDLSPEEATHGILEKLRPLYALWLASGFAPIRDLWLALAAGLGEPMTLRLGTETLTGLFRGIDGDGHLQIALDSGDSRSIAAADILPPL